MFPLFAFNSNVPRSCSIYGSSREEDVRSSRSRTRLRLNGRHKSGVACGEEIRVSATCKSREGNRGTPRASAMSRYRARKSLARTSGAARPLFVFVRKRLRRAARSARRILDKAASPLTLIDPRLGYIDPSRITCDETRILLLVRSRLQNAEKRHEKCYKSPPSISRGVRAACYLVWPLVTSRARFLDSSSETFY